MSTVAALQFEIHISHSKCEVNSLKERISRTHNSLEFRNASTS